MEKTLTVKSFFSQDNVRAKFAELLGKEAQGFITSILQVVSQNKYLANATPESVYNAAAMAAVLKLPIQSSLGFSYIVPYKNKDGVQEAQFMVGYKGFIQLCQRTGAFETIACTPIYEGQLIEENPLTGFIFDFTKKPTPQTKIIGYAAYFSLINGFKKTAYMTFDEVTAHGKRFSKSFNSGPWKTDFDSMAQKTVLKLLLGKYAPLSVDMQKAQIADQGIIKDPDTLEIDYVDEGPEQLTLEMIRELYVEKAGKLDEKETENIGRIINSKEEASYRKVYNLLIKL